MSRFIRPLNENLAIIYEEVKEKTTSAGIIVSGRAADDKSKPAVVIVAAIGGKLKNDIKVGDTVLWDRRALAAADNNTIIVHEGSILAIVET